MAFIEINAGLHANPDHVEWVADSDKHPEITQGKAPQGSSVLSVAGFVFVVEEPAQSLAVRIRDGQRGVHRTRPPTKVGPAEPSSDDDAPTEQSENPIPDSDAFAAEVANLADDDRQEVMVLIETLYQEGGTPGGPERVKIKKLLAKQPPPNIAHFLNTMLAFDYEFSDET